MCPGVGGLNRLVVHVAHVHAGGFKPVSLRCYIDLDRAALGQHILRLQRAQVVADSRNQNALVVICIWQFADIPILHQQGDVAPDSVYNLDRLDFLQGIAFPAGGHKTGHTAHDFYLFAVVHQDELTGSDSCAHLIGCQPLAVCHIGQHIVGDTLRDACTGNQSGDAAAKSGGRHCAALCRDVGCGKTVVAQIAALGMAMNGYQCAVMCPTLVLAEQHFADFTKFLARFGLSAVFLHGGMKIREEKKALAAIQSGEADVIVGTHSIFADKVKYKKLGLVIVDEEHRFGVEQRDGLKQKAKDGVHNISMSATPIPRTLATTLYGEGTEIINIHTMPAGRKPVKTIVWSNENTCMESVYKQIKQGHQCYIICPLIEDSDSETLAGVESVETTAQNLKAWFAKYPGVRIETISGDMKAKDVQAGIEAFAAGNADILISTTIVEVGVNIPNSTVIVIKNAERFGLAQLHQLRGRVGRSSYQSYCVLLSQDKENERLQTMASTTDGFKIAEKDLELRGTGQILGVKQSGKDVYMEMMLKYPKLYKEIRTQAAKDVILCENSA